MTHVPTGAPFQERGGRTRGVLDLVAGRYPGFLFGLPVSRALPVFHFHETTPAALEPAFRYLAENNYRTVLSDEVERIVRHGQRPPERSVMLAFDDAWASLWLVVGPLLKKYRLRAVTYAIPGRMQDAASTRPTMDDGPVDAESADRAPAPFVTWPELKALSDSGWVDVQSHTWSHSMVFCGNQPVGQVDAGYAAEPFLNRPRLNVDDPPEFLEPSASGAPLYARRSRMSDATRFLRAGNGTWRRETPDEQRIAIDHELDHARQVLQSRLGTTVNHVCLPWGVSGLLTTAALDRHGFATAFANRMSGRYVVSPGDQPFFLKRLNSRHIFALPGRGRRAFVTFP